MGYLEDVKHLGKVGEFCLCCNCGSLCMLRLSLVFIVQSDILIGQWISIRVYECMRGSIDWFDTLALIEF